MGDFAAAVSKAVAERKDAMLAVYRESVQRTIEYAQTPVGQGGNLPLKTGFLRASGQAVIGAEPPPLIGSGTPDGAYPYDAGQINLVIASATLDDTITFAWTAVYARRMNYGFEGADSLGRVYHQSGYQFAGLAAQRWPTTVSEVSAEAEAKIR